MVAKKQELKFIFKGCQVEDTWYPAEQYPVDNLPQEIKAAIERGWIEGYFKKLEQSNQAG
ncbi:hypothetical protein [Sporomusa sp.]|uniref:hypothetical protein n=1 Tax=Sporomusa sp. TaxID=2078658 RepID=UPI002CA61A40|nr:hypothetical protein [Sporomusa sp.]HWR43258.1 hypothetical protein [Sporomusa sp.]